MNKNEYEKIKRETLVSNQVGNICRPATIQNKKYLVIPVLPPKELDKFVTTIPNVTPHEF